MSLAEKVGPTREITGGDIRTKRSLEERKKQKLSTQEDDISSQGSGEAKDVSGPRKQEARRSSLQGGKKGGKYEKMPLWKQDWKMLSKSRMPMRRKLDGNTHRIGEKNQRALLKIRVSKRNEEGISRGWGKVVRSIRGDPECYPS